MQPDFHFYVTFNVHVNRIPLSGKIESLNYFEGKFIAAFEDKASENNERMEIGLVFSKKAEFILLRLPHFSPEEL